MFRSSDSQKNKNVVPFPLDHIKYVQVDYLHWPDMEKWTAMYEADVGWSSYFGAWEIFIDSCCFADLMNEKKAIVFLMRINIEFSYRVILLVQ